MISIISVYNKLNILEEMLLNSLNEQTVEYELILLDNTNNKYDSAAVALNEGIKKATGEIIVIVHQDVEFKSLQLDKMIEHLNELGDNVIVGVAGRKDSSGVITNIRHGKENKFAGKLRLSKPVEVQTLDEVCIAAPKKVFEETSFDEITCDNWHLYGTDFCLTNREKGIRSYVVPVDLFHKSIGVVNGSYYDSLLEVTKKHKQEFRFIYTSCSEIRTNNFLANTYILVSKAKIKLKKHL